MESLTTRIFASLSIFLIMAVPAVGMACLSVMFYGIGEILFTLAFAVLSLGTGALAVLISIEDFR
jgi:hypothetical protein